jgi:hypothetical protein
MGVQKFAARRDFALPNLYEGTIPLRDYNRGVRSGGIKSSQVLPIPAINIDHLGVKFGQIFGLTAPI